MLWNQGCSWQDWWKTTVHKGVYGTNHRFDTLWDSKAVAVKRVTTNIKKQPKSLILDSDVRRGTQKSVSPPSGTDSAPTFSSSDNDKDVRADRCLLKRFFHSRWSHRKHRKDEKRSSTSSRSAKSEKSPCTSDSDSNVTHSGSRSVHR